MSGTMVVLTNPSDAIVQKLSDDRSRPQDASTYEGLCGRRRHAANDVPPPKRYAQRRVG
jgi:hypothetical protein